MYVLSNEVFTLATGCFEGSGHLEVGHMTLGCHPGWWQPSWEAAAILNVLSNGVFTLATGCFERSGHLEVGEVTLGRHVG